MFSLGANVTVGRQVTKCVVHCKNVEESNYNPPKKLAGRIEDHYFAVDRFERLISTMDAHALREHLARLDAALKDPARLCIYGSGPLMLMGQEDRFSVDLDVAGPYSVVNERALADAATRIGFPVNPPDNFSNDHIEWVGPLRLCLAPPSDNAVTLWQGSRLTVFTVPPADLVASRLIRYDPTDQSDIQFLTIHQRLRYADVEQAVTRLPVPFRDDALVQENLANLRRDLSRWFP